MLRIITTLLIVACCHGYQLPRASVVGNSRLYVPTVLNFENEGNGEGFYHLLPVLITLIRSL